ncbi:hypothetical protein ABID96_002174 [Bacillus sp. OAE603]
MGKVISHQKIQQMNNIKQKSLFHIELTGALVKQQWLLRQSFLIGQTGRSNKE